MSNFSNVTSTCNLSESEIAFGQNARLVTSTVLTPFYFFLGLSGRIISLVSLHFETKSDGAYLYQTFVLVSECFEIVTFTIFVLIYYRWAFSSKPEALWFRKCYSCMWYAAYLADPLINICMSSTLLLTLAMTSDRILSLAKPILYRNLNHRKIQWTVLFCCVVFAILTSLVFALIFDVKMVGGLYTMDHSEFGNSTIRISLTKFHNAFKVVAAILLLISNFVLLYVYRRRMRDRARIQNSNSTAGGKEVHASKTLFKLTLCQSVLSTIGVFSNITYHMFEVASFDFTTCWADVIASFVDGIMELADILEFYLLLAVSQKFRGMVMRTLQKTRLFPCFRESGVQPISAVGGAPTKG